MSHLEQNAIQSRDIQISYNKMTVDVMAFGELTAKKLIRAFCHFYNVAKCHSTMSCSAQYHSSERLSTVCHSDK
jgi:hypothetical protein